MAPFCHFGLSSFYHLTFCIIFVCRLHKYITNFLWNRIIYYIPCFPSTYSIDKFQTLTKRMSVIQINQLLKCQVRRGKNKRRNRMKEVWFLFIICRLIIIWSPPLFQMTISRYMCYERNRKFLNIKPLYAELFSSILVSRIIEGDKTWW